MEKGKAKGETLTIHCLNDAEAIKEQLVQWGQGHVLARPFLEGSAACALRNLQMSFRRYTVVTSLILYRSERTKDIHVEMVYARCNTPLHVQVARQAMKDIMKRVRSSIHLPVEALLNRGRN